MLSRGGWPGGAGAEKSGRNAQGDSWWETWQEVFQQDELRWGGTCTCSAHSTYILHSTHGTCRIRYSHYTQDTHTEDTHRGHPLRWLHGPARATLTVAQRVERGDSGRSLSLPSPLSVLPGCSGLARIEKSAQKQAKSRRDGMWSEKWYASAQHPLPKP